MPMSEHPSADDLTKLDLKSYLNTLFEQTVNSIIHIIEFCSIRPRNVSKAGDTRPFSRLSVHQVSCVSVHLGLTHYKMSCPIISLAPFINQQLKHVVMVANSLDILLFCVCVFYDLRRSKCICKYFFILLFY